MTYFQKKHSHLHKWFVDNNTKETVCMCGSRKKSSNDPKGYTVPKERKYHNKTCIYDGYNYDSIKEAEYAMLLDYRKKQKEIKEWERQYPIEVYANGHKLFRMKVDFLVHCNDGSKELHEVKGYATDIFNLKLKCIEAIWLPEHPEYSYILIK